MYHTKQLGESDCGAAAAATVFGISYAQAFDLVKTTKDGTWSNDVFEAAKSLNSDSIIVSVQDELKNLWWIKNLSRKYPIFLSLYIKEQIAKRGRPIERHHGVALVKEKIYDPSEEAELDVDIYARNVKLCFVKDVIVFGKELETYGKNSF